MRGPSESRDDSETAAYEGSLLRRAAVAAACARIILSSVAFDPNGASAFAQPKALASQALDLVVLSLIVALALEHRRTMFAWSPLHVPVLAYGAIYVLAAVFALDQRVALVGTADRGLGLISVLDLVLLYFFVVIVVRTSADRLWVAGALAAATTIVVLYELIQWMGLDPIQWGRPSGQSLFSTLGNRGVLAQFLGVMAVAAAGMAVAPTGYGRRGRACAVVVAAVALGGALLAGGRASLLGLAAGPAMLGLVSIAWERSVRRRALLAGAAFGLIAAALALALASPVGERVGSIVRDPVALTGEDPDQGDASIAARMDLYGIALHIWRDRPILGVGPDNYAVAFPSYRTLETHKLHDFLVTQTSPHSWFAKVLTDSGLVGLLTFLAALAVALGIVLRGPPDAWRLAAAGGIASFLATGAVSVNHVGTESLLWLGLGLIAAPSAATSAANQTLGAGRGDRQSLGRRPGRVALGLVGLTLLVAPFTIREAVEASHYAKLARGAVAAGDRTLLPAAMTAGEKAVSLDPGRAEYWYWLGSAYFRSERIDGAVRAWSRAAEAEPFQWPYITDLARAQLTLGLRGDERALAAGLEVAKRANETDKLVPDVQYVLALAASANDEHDLTVQAGELWLRLADSPDDTLTGVVADAYLDLDRPDQAERWIGLTLRSNGPGEVKLRLLLARALVAQDRRDEAATQLDLVLALEPQNPSALRLRSDLAGGD